LHSGRASDQGIPSMEYSSSTFDSSSSENSSFEAMFLMSFKDILWEARFLVIAFFSLGKAASASILDFSFRSLSRCLSSSDLAFTADGILRTASCFKP